ncbi:MAG: choice-of-anchor B family protein [Phycisphaerales bacterium]
MKLKATEPTVGTSNYRRLRRASMAAAGAGVIAVAIAAEAHESWRKASAELPAVVAPAWSLSDGGLGGVDDPSTRFESENATLLAWIPVSAFAGGNKRADDCWGYTSPSGREYAILGVENGFGFVEVTNPTSPVILDTIAGATSNWHDVKIIGEYAYGVSEGGLGIQVMDLGDIDNGVVTLVQNKTQLGHQTSHNIISNPDSGYIYVCGANIANGGLLAVNIDDPTDPVIVGQWSESYVHDAQVVSYTEGPFAGRELAFCFNGFNGVAVLDVTDKSNIVQIGENVYDDLGYTHQGWLSDDRQLLYVNDELDEVQLGVLTNTRVFDVSDPANPTLLGAFGNGLGSVDHNNYVRGDTLYQANYRSGLRVFDLSADPVNPTEIAWFDTFPAGDEAEFNGAWSTYPFFDSGIVLISDIERGLFIVDVSGDSASDLEITVDGEAPQFLPPFGDAIAIQINEIEGMVQDGSVQLHVRRADGEMLIQPMTALGGGAYEGNFPSLPCFETIEYWFEAHADDGRTFRAPLSAPFVNFHATIVDEVRQIAFDSFETDTGWTVENIDVGSGPWERGATSPRGFSAIQPLADFDGTDSSFETGLEEFGFLRGGPTILTSPVFDVTDLGEEVFVRFAAWFVALGDQRDTLRIELSPDGGDTWTLARTIGDVPDPAQLLPGRWSLQTLRIADTVDLTDALRVRFIVGGPAVPLTEAAIDAFEIVQFVCESCQADVTGDGALDIFDFLAFQNFFDSGDLRADFDGDGSLTIFDFLAFQTAFDIGCG